MSNPPKDDEEEDFDLSELERDGIDGVVARLGTDPDEEPVELPRRRGRSPLLSLAVVAFGIYLLVTMWGDFRYWMASSEPVDLGRAADFVEDGRVPEGYDNTYVKISGTPDVQHAARLSTKKRYVGYRRLTEAGGSLFAAIPRSRDDQVTNTFIGEFEGRMMNLSDHGAFGWIQQFFDAEKILHIVDTTPEAVRAARETGVLETEQGEVRIGEDDRLRLVFDQPEATVQLGKSSFPRKSEAVAAMARLGVPFLEVDRAKTAPYWMFLARIPDEARSEAEQTLSRDIEVDDPADPRQGVLVLPRTATFTAPVDQVSFEGNAVSFPYDDNTTSPGYDLADGELVERSVDEGRLRLDAAGLKAIRLEKPIRVDPDGYVIIVGETPDEMRTNGLLWLVVLAITGVNLYSVLLWWRRRRGGGGSGSS